jgi:hypothetical protein
MANPVTTFVEYFGTTANPYVPHEAQYNGFALQPQGIMQSLESEHYLSALIAATTDNTHQGREISR